MDLDLKNKAAFVTAASSGLGLAAARALLAEGCRVFVSSKTPAKLKSAVSELSHLGEVSGVAGDLTEPSELDGVIQRAQGFLKQIDIAVVSTGHPPTHPSSAATDSMWKTGFDLLLQPAIQITRTLAPMMCASGYGRLIYVGSIFGLQPEPSSVVQSTFRTGLNAFAKCISAEFAEGGVTANVICPGYFDTPLVQTLAQHYAAQRSTSLQSVLSEWKNFAPSRKFGKPSDFGALVAFLSSPRAEFISGTALTIDGGAIRQY